MVDFSKEIASVSVGQIERMLNMLTDSRPCKLCRRTIWMLTTRNGKQMPVTNEMDSHFVDCPHAASFRRSK